jgi:hypothetical protein
VQADFLCKKYTAIVIDEALTLLAAQIIQITALKMPTIFVTVRRTNVACSLQISEWQQMSRWV